MGFSGSVFVAPTSRTCTHHRGIPISTPTMSFRMKPKDSMLFLSIYVGDFLALRASSEWVDFKAHYTISYVLF